MEHPAINPIDVKIGENIRKWRTHRGMTQEALGAALARPVKGATIGTYETGSNQLYAQRLVEIAAVLGCIVSDLLDGVPGIILQRDHSIELQEVLADPEFQKRIQSFARATIGTLANHMRNTQR